jgi:hypothetical protein
VDAYSRRPPGLNPALGREADLIFEALGIDIAER